MFWITKTWILIFFMHRWRSANTFCRSLVCVCFFFLAVIWSCGLSWDQRCCFGAKCAAGRLKHASHLQFCECVFLTLCHNTTSVFLCVCVCVCVCVLCVAQIRQCDLLFSPQPEPIDSPQAGGPGTAAFCQSLEWAGGWMDYSIVTGGTQLEIWHYIKLKPVIRKTMARKLRNLIFILMINSIF